VAPRQPSSDHEFHCPTCWQKFSGGVPERSVSYPPAACALCDGADEALYMWDPYDACSDLAFYCQGCWLRSCGLVPGKALFWPCRAAREEPERVASSPHAHSAYKNVLGTDFGFPTPGMLVHSNFLENTKAMQRLGVRLQNRIDATAPRAEILCALELSVEQRVGLVCWGSPHPNSFTELLPRQDLRTSSNSEYKASMFEFMKRQFPEANVFMPCPRYYNLPGARFMKLDAVGDVRYEPMASCTNSFQRLASEAMVLADGPDVDAKAETVDLRMAVQDCLRRHEVVIFFGEYICSLSYCAVMPRT